MSSDIEGEAKVYYRQVHFWGKITLGAAVIIFASIGFYLSYGLGFHPGWNNILSALVSIAAMVGHTWVNVGDQITYILLMGPAATYMSCLTGNIKNMRLPSAMASAAIAGKNASRPKRDILSTIGVFSSTIVNTTFMIIVVFAGSYIIKILPERIMSGLGYVVPALFGAIFAQFALMSPRTAVLSLVSVFLILWMSFIPSFISTFITILLAVAINILVAKFFPEKREQKKTKE
jgi:hypothetical protein